MSLQAGDVAKFAASLGLQGKKTASKQGRKQLTANAQYTKRANAKSKQDKSRKSQRNQLPWERQQELREAEKARRPQTAAEKFGQEFAVDEDSQAAKPSSKKKSRFAVEADEGYKGKKGSSMPGFGGLNNDEDEQGNLQLWFEQGVGMLGSYARTDHTRQQFASVEAAYEHIKSIFWELTAEFREISQMRNRWIGKLIRTGTLHDKVAAFSLMVQENPVMRLDMLDAILKLGRRPGSREGLLVLDPLKDLFTNTLLPDDRALKNFAEHEFDVPLSDSQLILWFFEGELKNRYREFILSLREGANAAIIHAKRKYLITMKELLNDRQEAEHLLLIQIVEKFKDHERKIAGIAVSTLHEILQNHPGMKNNIVDEISALVFQPHTKERARYYGVICLNQIQFAVTDGALARKMIKLYFSLFHVYTNKQEAEKGLTAAAIKRQQIKRRYGLDAANRMEKKQKAKRGAGKEQERTSLEFTKTKLLGALLTGVNRAFVFSKEGCDVEELTSMYDEELKNLFVVTRDDNFTTVVQSLQLLFQVATIRDDVEHRFYRALYHVLFSRALANASKKTMFFNLLYKALKADSDVSRVAAFVKRLLQLALNSPPEFICGVLLIISETMRVHPELVAMITNTVDTQEESVGDQKDGDDTAAVYDPLKQSPRLALAESSCLWELSTLVEHYHPTVVIFAQTLLKQEHIEGEADPLNDYTNSRFLEKFVFKNPKKIKALPQDRAHMAKFIRPQRDASLETRVTSKQFLAQDVADVAADERFFHQYFTARAISRDNVSDSRKLKRKRKHMDIEEYADSIMDEELDRLGGMEDQFEMEWTDSDEEAKTGSAFADKEDSSDGEWVEFDPEAVAREKAGVAALIANEFKGMELPAAFADVADAEVDLDDISMSEDSSDDEEDVLPEGAYGSESDSDIGSLFAGDDTDDSSGSESSDIGSDVDDADLEKAKSAKRKVFASGAEFTKILERSAESSVDKYTAARASDNGKQGGKQRKFKKRRKN